MTRVSVKAMISALFGVCAVVLLAPAAHADVVRLQLRDEITPASAEVIRSAITKAETENARVLIIEIDTPGGLETSMREIVSDIIASKVPVVVYVAPSGARAASAGFVILLSADVAAMSPGTATGAAQPVMMGGREMDDAMKEKVINDAAAYVRSLAEKRGRNSEAAESTVRESKSFTEREALEGNLIGVIANDTQHLIAQLQGREVRRFDGSTQTLELTGRVVEYEPTLRQKLLLLLADPRVAFVMFAIGALCLYFELQHPGAIVPGVVGALAVVLALYGFHMLPINLTGVLLIVVAVGLFILEASVQGFGVLGAGGIVAAVIGSLILIDVPPELSGLRLPLGLVLGVVVPFAIILIFMLRLALRSRHVKVTTGQAGMIGLRGRAYTPIAPEGMVFVRGELWRARSHMRVARDEPVRVSGIDGLLLEVEAIRDDSIEPRKTSALDEQ